MTKNRENRMSKGRNTNSIKWMSFEFQFWEVTGGNLPQVVDTIRSISAANLNN